MIFTIAIAICGPAFHLEFRPTMLKTFNHYFLVSLALLPLLFTACVDDDLDLSPTVSTSTLVSADALVIEEGNTISYRDRSVGAISWSWDFIGGDPERSTDRSPRTTYPAAGTFVTSLITNFEDGTRRRHSLRPRVLPRMLPDFSVASRQNEVNTPVIFSNLTTGIGELPASLAESDNLAAYEWTFTGGTPATSTASNPSVTYASAGTFDVTLKVTRSVTDSEEIISKPGFIEIQ